MNFDSFYTYLTAEKRCSQHTLVAYSSDLAQFTVFCKEQFDIDETSDVTQAVVRSWLAELMNRKYGIASIHRHLSSIRSCFRFLQREGIVETNPARGIVKPRLPGRLPAFVEEKNMLRLCNDFALSIPADFGTARDQLIVLLFYETGMRRAELINLRDRDIDFSLQQLKVTGKRNKVRFIPVSQAMLGRISHYIRLRDVEVPSSSGFMLVSGTGKKIEINVVYDTVKKYLSAITTIKKKSPHVLRHTFATHMLNNGADLLVIKEILGHTSLAATQVYTHNTIEKLKAVHRKLHPRK